MRKVQRLILEYTVYSSFDENTLTLPIEFESAEAFKSLLKQRRDQYHEAYTRWRDNEVLWRAKYNELGNKYKLSKARNHMFHCRNIVEKHCRKTPRTDRGTDWHDDHEQLKLNLDEAEKRVREIEDQCAEENPYSSLHIPEPIIFHQGNIQISAQSLSETFDVYTVDEWFEKHLNIA